MYIHLNLMEEDMLEPHINFQPLKRLKYMSQFPANQKLMTSNNISSLLSLVWPCGHFLCMS